MSLTAAASPSTEYDAFAPHYDEFTSGSDYERWTDHVLEHARAHGLSGRTLLDLACGTGNSFLPFLRRRRWPRMATSPWETGSVPQAMARSPERTTVVPNAATAAKRRMNV